MLFTSLRPYPISLTNPTGQTIVLYPGQTIDLPESFGLRFSGLLMPSQTPQVTPTPKVIKEPIKFTNDVPTFTEDYVAPIVEDVVEKEEEHVSEILQETMKIANERKDAKKKEDKKEDTAKRKAGRPKKEK